MRLSSVASLGLKRQKVFFFSSFTDRFDSIKVCSSIELPPVQSRMPQETIHCAKAFIYTKSSMINDPKENAMSLPLNDEKAASTTTMYIRGIPFKCPGQPRKTDTQTPTLAMPASGRDAAPRSGRLPARLVPTDATRAVVSRGEAESQGLFMKRRREVRVFADKAVPMRQLRELLTVDVQVDSLRFVIVEAPSTMDRVTSLVASWLRQEGIVADGLGQDADARKILFGNASHLALIHGKIDDPQAAAACALAAARLEWLASGMGLGACFAGEIVLAAVGSSEIAAALAVPTGYATMAALLLGYPAQPAADAGQSRPRRVTWL